MSPRRPRPAPTRRLAAAVLAGLAWSLVTGVTAPAHVAVRLDIRSPQPGQRVRTPVELVVFAQPMLGGVDRVEFTVAVDDQPVDPRSGRPAPAPAPASIQSSTTRRVPLADLVPGRHRATVSYRADADEPLRQTTVEFVVAQRPARTGPFLVAVAVVLAAVLSALAVAVRGRVSRPDGGRRQPSG